MIKLEVIEDFTLSRFDELKNLKRANLSKEGRLFKKDTFECNKELADYLLGENKLKKAFVKIIEVEPKKDSKIICEDEEVEKLFEEKPKKKKTKKED